MSAIRSSACSMPIETRIVVSRTPIRALTSAGTPEWVVVAGRRRVALIGLQEVHAHFTLGTDDAFMYFYNRI